MNYVRFSPELAQSILYETGVPPQLWDEAIESIEKGYSRANSFKSLFANVTAPLVVPFALLFTKWESEHLPKFFSWYDNDVSINGDRGVPVPTGDEAIKLNYWAEGHHPRSFWSRYVWLGLRNRGKEAYMEKLPEGHQWTPERSWGESGITRGSDGHPPVEGWNVVESGGYWEIRGVQKFAGNFRQEPRWGWKTGLSRSMNNGEVMSVGINLKIRKPSGE